MGAHHHASPAHRWRLAVAFAITTAVLLAEVAGALITGSLALLVDAAHMLTDAGGLLMALLASQGRLPVKQNRAVGVIYQGHSVGTPGEIEVEIEMQGDQVKAVHVGGCAALDREGYWQSE